MGRAVFNAEANARGIRFTVGRDAQGRWVVSDRDGLVGGLFTDRAAAVHFAMFESDHEPGAVCCVPDMVTFSLGPVVTERALGPAIGTGRKA
ncbi:hypothetical protein EPK99_15525 [Neorhizobium lilium]|uniref:Uncharacterized protein n=1 Tax=Neorhizobium lilium TaxID=2503024 RepID=A0A3S3RIM7_9HYPH|nr:hypothetical protein [Neorhizobium lilium]RWX77067.1 hypothetical protein EPK99_15525 [Neorhizobium lilium]